MNLGKGPMFYAVIELRIDENNETNCYFIANLVPTKIVGLDNAASGVGDFFHHRTVYSIEVCTYGGKKSI